MSITEIASIIADYLELFPNEQPRVAAVQERLKHDEQFNHRKSFSGHGTGAAIVLSPDKKKLLLIHHKGLNKWLQPGGHWDPEDPDPWTVAARETEEETGVIARLLPVDPERPHIPIDIDTHFIPASERKQEPEHYHHDFRYVLLASSEAVKPREDEVNEVVWVPLDSDDERLDYFRPIIAKMRQHGLL